MKEQLMMEKGDIQATALGHIVATSESTRSERLRR